MKKTWIEDNLIREIESRKIHIQKALIKWGEEHYRHFPWREKRTPYSVLISEILLKRTTASAAKRMYDEFMSSYPNLETLAKADKEKLENLLETIGYHKRRTDILIQIANYILIRYGREIPKTKEDLLEIPFVGPYTASAILSLGYGIPSAMVDSNVERIIRRLFLEYLSEKKSFRRVLEIADRLAPKENNQSYNYALLDFGAAICRYGKPKCNLCPTNNSCDYYSSRSEKKSSQPRVC